MDKDIFILQLLQNNVFKVGEFITNTKHCTNYYVNTSNICSGSLMLEVGKCMSETIMKASKKSITGFDIDIIASPAYKGIPLSVSTCIAMQLMNSEYDLKYCSMRKNDKTHGEQGKLVGTPLTNNAKVIIVDDVLSTGTTIRFLIDSLKQIASITIVGVIVLIDRCDCWENGTARESLSKEYGIPVFSVINAKDVVSVATSHIEFLPVAKAIMANIKDETK